MNIPGIFPGRQIRQAVGALALSALLAFSITAPVGANQVKLDENRDNLQVIHEGRVITVERIQDLDNVITGDFARTSRPCPHFCIQPQTVADGVRTLGEVEVFDFMQGPLARGSGVLVDNRVPSFFERGTIPGSINIPFTVFEKDAADPELIEALERLGAVRRDGRGFLERFGIGARDKTEHWDFSDAQRILMWCNGPWCDQSPRGIRALLELGYPADRILYYRGGMQMWKSFGLNTVTPSGD